jgi:hypothetical protein
MDRFAAKMQQTSLMETIDDCKGLHSDFKVSIRLLLANPFRTGHIEYARSRPRIKQT